MRCGTRMRRFGNCAWRRPAPGNSKNGQLDRRSCGHSENSSGGSLSGRDFEVAGAAGNDEKLAESVLLVVPGKAAHGLESDRHGKRLLQYAGEFGGEEARDQVAEAVDLEDGTGPSPPRGALRFERAWPQVIVDR